MSPKMKEKQLFNTSNYLELKEIQKIHKVTYPPSKVSNLKKKLYMTNGVCVCVSFVQKMSSH